VPANPVAEEAVRNVLLGVIDPELGDNIVDLGMVQVIEIGPQNGDVNVTIALTTAGCPLRAQIMKDIKLRVASLPGVPAAPVHFGEMSAEQKKNVMARARWKARDNALDTDIPATTRIVAIASGKGGVGKSSVTANLAAQLAQRGLTVGVLDADIGGFSIPRMLGVEGRVQGVRDESGRARFGPLEKPVGPGLLKVVSMGSIEGTGEDQAIMWRGFMLNRAVQHFLEDVAWGDMHYLLIDLPPGTADIQMGLARMLPPHRGGDRHHPGAGRPAGCRSGGRHGPQGLPAGSRGRREHERVRGSRRHPVCRVRLGRGRAAGRTARRAPAGIDPTGPDRGRRGRRR
jgi:ATP-binding protein involved in chromosome partitioning